MSSRVPFTSRKQVTGPVFESETCDLVSRKLHEYYKFKYDPTSLVNFLLESKIYTSSQLDIFDLTPRENCCNVISIALYFVYTTLNALYDSTRRYIYSIYRSVKNTQKYLPDWIIRIYLDPSVYKIFDLDLTTLSGEFPPDVDILYHMEEIRSLLNYILKAPNVEIYSYYCPSTQNNIHRVRTYRFLPFSDPEVNFCAIREADCILTKVDCHNLSYFMMENPGRLFYLPPTVPIYELYDKTAPLYQHGPNSFFGNYSSYNMWLIYYKEYYDPEFFNTYLNCYDLLAGTFSLRFKLKRSYYLEASDRISTWIEDVIDNPNHPIHSKYFKLNIESMITGYDEILLLDMFKSLISMPLNIPIEEAQMFIDTIFYASNIDSYDISEYISEAVVTNDFTNLIDYLKSLKLITRTPSYLCQYRGPRASKGKTFVLYMDSILTPDPSVGVFNLQLGYIINGSMEYGYIGETILEYLNLVYDMASEVCLP